MYTVVIENNFNAAHAVMMPNEQMEELHSHNWKVRIALSKSQLDELGFAIEFGQIQAVLGSVLEEFEGKNLNDLKIFEYTCPTTEVVAQYVYSSIKKRIGDTARLDFVDITESPGCQIIYSE